MAIPVSRRHGYSRKRSTKEPRPSIVVLVEGEVTEVEYLSALRDALGIPRTLVSISSAAHSDADGLVGEAKDLLRPNKKRASSSQIGAPDEVWVVSDTEYEHENGSPENIARAINRAGNNVYLVLDSPSIEYWFLLHFWYTTRCYENAKSVIEDLRNYWPEYSKQEHSLDWATLIDNTDVALRHARRVRNHRENTDSKQPIADADILVERLRSLGKDGLARADADHQQNEKQPSPRPTCEDLYSRRHLREGR